MLNWDCGEFNSILLNGVPWSSIIISAPYLEEVLFRPLVVFLLLFYLADGGGLDKVTLLFWLLVPPIEWPRSLCKLDSLGSIVI